MKSRLIYSLLIIIFSLFPYIDLFCGEFPTDTIFISGPQSNRINFVFLSDGYQQFELNKFIADVKNSVDYFFKVIPFSNYKNYFNIFAIRVPSVESGASHPRTAPDCPDSASHPKIKVNNYFGSAFDANGVHRALVAFRGDSIFNVLKRNFPDYDQAFILVNTPFYGGTGGTFPTSSTTSSAAEIILHEFAHSFARVSDEYGGNCTYRSIIGPNVTMAKKYDSIPWNKWIDKSTPLPTPANSQYQTTPGLFIGAFYCDTGWSRPQYSCKMRSLGVPYCVVCTQTIIEKIHSLVSPIDSYSPQNLSLSFSDTILNFKLNLVKTIPNTIFTTWSIDSSAISNLDSFSIDTKILSEGFHVVTATVNDTTQLSRELNHLEKVIHKKIITWDINKSASGINLKNPDFLMDVGIYPNPFNTEINITLSCSDIQPYKIELADIRGNIVFRADSWQVSGNQNTIRIDMSDYKFREGGYYLIIKKNGQLVVKELIKIQ